MIFYALVFYLALLESYMILYFYFLTIYYSALLKKMLHRSVLGNSLMSQQLLIFKLFKYLLYLLRYGIYDEIFKKFTAAPLEKISKSYFNFIFFLIFHKITPGLVSIIKTKKHLLCILKSHQEHFSTS